PSLSGADGTPYVRRLATRDSIYLSSRAVPRILPGMTASQSPELARRRPVVGRDGRAARLGELQLFARPLRVAASLGVHGDEKRRRALAVDALGRLVGFGGDLELAGRQLAEQEFRDRPRPLVEIVVADILVQLGPGITPGVDLGGVTPQRHLEARLRGGQAG